jgi:histidine triad (HIT) family protein
VKGCVFCDIVAGTIPAYRVFDDSSVLGFLDHRPLLPGHVLVIPKTHYQTLGDLPAPEVGPFFLVVQRLALAVEQAMHAEGSFVAANIRISQSVPHLHVHVVPRKPKDGLRGFFWPRQKYESNEQLAETHDAVKAAIERLR